MAVDGGNTEGGGGHGDTTTMTTTSGTSGADGSAAAAPTAACSRRWMYVAGVLAAILALLLLMRWLRGNGDNHRRCPAVSAAPPAEPDRAVRGRPTKVVPVPDGGGAVEMLPSAGTIPSAKSVRLVVANGPAGGDGSAPPQRLTAPMVFLRALVSVGAGASTQDQDSTQPAYLELSVPMVIRQMEIFAVARDVWVPASALEFLDADGRVVLREPVPRFFNTTRINLELAPAYRPLVWDAHTAVLQTSNSGSGVYNDIWHPFGAPTDLIHAHSRLGLIKTQDAAEVRVDSLWMGSPTPRPIINRPVFLVVQLPAIERMTRLFTLSSIVPGDDPRNPTGGTELTIVLGYEPTGPRLVYHIRGTSTDGQVVASVTPDETGVGDPIAYDRPLVLGLQFQADTVSKSLSCTVVHPSGALYRVIYDGVLPAPDVRFAALWSDPDAARLRPDPKRRLKVHEICAFPFLTSALTDGQLRNIHTGLKAKWSR